MASKKCPLSDGAATLQSIACGTALPAKDVGWWVLKVVTFSSGERG